MARLNVQRKSRSSNRRKSFSSGDWMLGHVLAADTCESRCDVTYRRLRDVVSERKIKHVWQMKPRGICHQYRPNRPIRPTTLDTSLETPTRPCSPGPLTPEGAHKPAHELAHQRATDEGVVRLEVASVLGRPLNRHQVAALILDVFDTSHQTQKENV